MAAASASARNPAFFDELAQLKAALAGIVPDAALAGMAPEESKVAKPVEESEEEKKRREAEDAEMLRLSKIPATPEQKAAFQSAMYDAVAAGHAKTIEQAAVVAKSMFPAGREAAVAAYEKSLAARKAAKVVKAEAAAEEAREAIAADEAAEEEALYDGYSSGEPYEESDAEEDEDEVYTPPKDYKLPVTRGAKARAQAAGAAAAASASASASGAAAAPRRWSDQDYAKLVQQASSEEMDHRKLAAAAYDAADSLRQAVTTVDRLNYSGCRLPEEMEDAKKSLANAAVVAVYKLTQALGATQVQEDV